MAGLPYFDLSGKTAIVTGGAAGIGRGIAEGLAEAGADVVVTSRSLDKCTDACMEIAGSTGAKTLPLAFDLRDRHSIDNLVEKAIEYFGHVDILVNNAAVIEEKPILEMDEATWDLMLDTNLKGVFNLSRAAAKYMIEQNQGGKVINVASIAGLIAWPKMSAYCASKGGVIQLTKVMAVEWARHNIQANAILPGYFLTPMSTEFVNSSEGEEVIRSNVPLRRVAQIDEVKGLAVLLASKGSSYITGATFTIDGGQSCR